MQSRNAPKPASFLTSTYTGMTPVLVTVADVMQSARVLLAPGDYLYEAMNVMQRLRVQSLVVEPLLPISPWSIVTLRDVQARIAANGSGLPRVREVMTTPPFVVAPLMRIEDCSTLLLANRLRRVVVVQGEQPVGIICDTDIFQAIEARR